MKIAVCNRFWATAGGGESYALAIARALQEMGDVDLIAPADVDWTSVAERLRVRPDAFLMRPVDFDRTDELVTVSRGYDLFVNTTYGTTVASAAAVNLLVVHFPTRLPEGVPRWQRFLALKARGSKLISRAAAIAFVDGFNGWERGARAFRWTDGAGKFLVWAPPNTTVDCVVTLGPERPAPTDVAIEYRGTTIATGTTRPHETTDVAFKVTGRGSGEPVGLLLRSGTFRPSDFGVAGDDRVLGVQVVDIRVDDGRLTKFLPAHILEDFGHTKWLDGYDGILVNSSFTREWVRRWWGREAEILYPSAVPRPCGAKANIILSVGRFFDPAHGHGKRQLEMVRAFADIVRGGVSDWELHLVGGCKQDDAPYFETVRREAQGLPVSLHPDLSGQALDDLYARASLYWHATGLTEDVQRHPERQEHFGISVVEAMSAGCVPIVHGVAGPAEIVRDGVDGYQFRSAGELVAKTRALIANRPLAAQMSASSRTRSGAFTDLQLRTTLARVVRQLCPG